MNGGLGSFMMKWNQNKVTMRQPRGRYLLSGALVWTLCAFLIPTTPFSSDNYHHSHSRRPSCLFTGSIGNPAVAFAAPSAPLQGSVRDPSTTFQDDISSEQASHRAQKSSPGGSASSSTTHNQNREGHGVKVGPARSDDILIAATVDGRYHAIRAKDGNRLWNFDVDQPFLSSFQMDQTNDSASIGTAIMVPAVDGSIFAYDYYSIQRLPNTVQQLVERSPFSDGDQTVVTGATSATMYGVDLETGALKAVFPPGGGNSDICLDGDEGKHRSNAHCKRSQNLVWLTQKHHNVRAFQNGIGNREIWNFTVGDVLTPQVTAAEDVAPPVENFDSDGTLDETSHATPKRSRKSRKRSPRSHQFEMVLTSTVQGHLMALREDNGEWLWQKSLGVPVLAMFRIGSSTGDTTPRSFTAMRVNFEEVWPDDAYSSFVSLPPPEHLHAALTESREKPPLPAQVYIGSFGNKQRFATNIKPLSKTQLTKIIDGYFNAVTVRDKDAVAKADDTESDAKCKISNWNINETICYDSRNDTDTYDLNERHPTLRKKGEEDGVHAVLIDSASSGGDNSEEGEGGFAPLMSSASNQRPQLPRPNVDSRLLGYTAGARVHDAQGGHADPYGSYPISTKHSFAQGFSKLRYQTEPQDPSTDDDTQGWKDLIPSEYLGGQSESSEAEKVEQGGRDSVLVPFVIVWNIEHEQELQKRSDLVPMLTAAVTRSGLLHHIQIGRSAVQAAKELMDEVTKERSNIYLAHVSVPSLLRYMLKSPWPLSNIGVWTTMGYAYFSASSWFPPLEDEMHSLERFEGISDASIWSSIKWILGLGYYGQVEADENPLVLISSIIAVAVCLYIPYRTIRNIRKYSGFKKKDELLQEKDTIEFNRSQPIQENDHVPERSTDSQKSADESAQGSLTIPVYKTVNGRQYQFVDELGISEHIMGYGSHGTVVYAGLLEGRPVAVKKMLKSFFKTAEREINLLIKSDGHPNVVRYFNRKEWGDFVHLALEQCDCSLDSAILKSAHRRHFSKESQGVPIAVPSAHTRSFLKALVSGVHHLHCQRIVHRDLKPQNILLKQKANADDENSDQKKKVSASHREFHQLGLRWIPKISDMGLGKLLLDTTASGTQPAPNTSSTGSYMAENRKRVTKAQKEEKRRQKKARRHETMMENKFAGAVVSESSSDENSASEDNMSTSADTQTITGNAPGTVGWQAPEILRQLYNSMGNSWQDFIDRKGANAEEEQSEEVPSDDTSEGEGQAAVQPSRSSRLVDVWSLGCIIYYVVDAGEHPFGAPFEREGRILSGKPDLRRLDHIPELQHLLKQMLHSNPRKRPRTSEILEHPFFWDDEKRSQFLQDVSDRLEIEPEDSVAVRTIESKATSVVGTSWDKRLPPEFLSEMSRYRRYNFGSVLDCLRVFRNKRNHYRDIPQHLRSNVIGSDSYVALVPFFLAPERFPRLLITCYEVAVEMFAHEPHFQEILGQYTCARYLRKPRRRVAPQMNRTTASDSRTQSRSWYLDYDSWHDACLLSSHRAATDNPMIYKEGDDGRVLPRSRLNELVDKEKLFRYGIPHGTNPAFAAIKDESNNEIIPVISAHEKIRMQNTKYRGGANINNSRYKTKLCQDWFRTNGGYCARGIRCDFAHGAVEMRVQRSLEQLEEDMHRIQSNRRTGSAATRNFGKAEVAADSPNSLN